jgi:hypothetical protein
MSDGKGGHKSKAAAFHALVGRALTDQDFRKQLRGDSVDEALTSVGVEPTPEIKKALGAAMDNVDELANQFGGVKAAT